VVASQDGKRYVICSEMARVGGRGLGVVGELGIYGRGGFKFHQIPGYTKLELVTRSLNCVGCISSYPFKAL